VIFHEQFFGYVSRNEPVFKHELIRTSDMDGERLWLLDEGHCFRDQLVRFCRMEEVRLRQGAYRLGSLDTFMRMVESGKGITFIPELATHQLSREQKELVRPFAIPRPTREIVLVTRRDFIRHTLAEMLINSIRESVPKEMWRLQAGQQVV
jgi:LysR family hydrogen peroxide-inducible transcriptional activator